MKTLIFVFCIFSIVASGQRSSYNQGLKNTSLKTGEWFLDEGDETFITNQNPVGYKKTYDELKKILNYYNLNIMEADTDESLIDKTVENLYDFQNLSNSLSIEWSSITMRWRSSDNYQINWNCNNSVNLIMIIKIK